MPNQQNHMVAGLCFPKGNATPYLHNEGEGMKATMTRDLITGDCRISVKTCSEAINYMGEIYGFIRDTGIFCRMNTDFYTVNFNIKGGSELNEYVPKIMQFIDDITNGRIKPN